jgi:hypothetical protein
MIQEPGDQTIYPMASSGTDSFTFNISQPIIKERNRRLGIVIRK